MKGTVHVFNADILNAKYFPRISGGLLQLSLHQTLNHHLNNGGRNLPCHTVVTEKTSGGEQGYTGPFPLAPLSRHPRVLTPTQPGEWTWRGDTSAQTPSTRTQTLLLP